MNLKTRANEMKNFFDKVVKIDYDQKHLKLIENKRKILNFLPEKLDNILDLGCGTGLELISVFEKYPNTNVLAIDVSEEMTNVLKRRNLSKNLNIVNESYFDYDFGKEKFDAVISTQSLHHFEPEDKVKLYTKVYNSLKDNGVFVNEDYFASTKEEELKMFDEYYNLVKGEGKHYDTPLTVEHEISVLKEAGFTMISSDINPDCKIIIARK